MRKPRDFDAELKALNDRARILKDRKIRQLGELVIATGADALEVDTLAGGLLAMVETKADGKDAMRTRGVAFFQGNGRREGGAGTPEDNAPATKADGTAQPFELSAGQD